MSEAPGAAAGTADRKAAAHKIGPVSCLAFAVGTMVGGGVFTLSGTAINDAGPAALVSYALAGIVMFLSAISFVAVAARAEPGDSGYGPIEPILGRVWRFLAMWGFYLNALMLVAFLLVSFGDYLSQYFITAIGVTAAGLIAITAIGLLNLGPADLVGKAETYVVAVKIALLVFFAVWGITKLTGADLQPFSPHGSSSVFGASALLFTAYTGFNVITNMAGSVKRPERTVPFAVLASVVISALIYVGVVLAMLASGVQHFGAAGVAQAAQALMGDWGGYLIAFAACLSTLSGANANLLGGSELMLRLVAQGDAPPAAGRTTKRGHPFMSVLGIALAAVALVLVANVDNVVTLANVTALVAMIIVNAAAFRLALQGWPGPGLKLPGGVLIPTVATVACLLQFPSLGWGEVLVGLALMAAGLLFHGTRHLQGFGAGMAERANVAIARLETPLAFALRTVERHTPGTRARRDARSADPA